MKIINFDIWVRRKTNNHSAGFTQIIDTKYINIILFGCRWKAVSWTVYIDEFND